uniref:Major fimbrial subunit protein N-terminal domain-containing protein n=1 Tax=termite gut metagenome TaxID=433724 RepID=S0DFU0_9ZZZZ
MKTIFKSALIACAALTAGLAGCQKENGSGIGKDEKVVRLQFTQEAVGGTRAAATHVGEEPIVLTDAYVYFTTAGGDIVAQVQIDFSLAGKGAAYNSSANTVGSDLITADGGTEITGVPASATKVVIVGNAPSATYITGGNINDFTGINVDGLYDATNKGVAKVALFGINTLTPVPGDDTKYTSNVQVAPVGARFEIGSIAGDYDVAPITSHIKSFTLEGIYINNYYPTMSIDGSGLGAIVHNSTTVANYNGAVAPSKYATLNGSLADYGATIVGQGTAPYNAYAPKATPAATDVWAYNVLAPDGGDVPHIVVRLSSVVVKTTDSAGKKPGEAGYVETLNNTTYAGTKFLTVRNIYVDGSSTPLASFQRGYVYRIVKLSFAQQHLTDKPETTTIDITVEAELMTWVPKDVDYDFN